jgi:hypothetical protein
MPDPSLELQRVILARLKADAELTAIVNGRIYDRPPTNAAFPYVTLGEADVLAQRADCYDGSDVSMPIHGWSRAVGFPEAKRIASAIRASLHEAPLVLAAGERLVEITVTDNRALRDPDGLTSHTVVTVRALTEPT